MLAPKTDMGHRVALNIARIKATGSARSNGQFMIRKYPQTGCEAPKPHLYTPRTKGFFESRPFRGLPKTRDFGLKGPATDNEDK